jgi:hypothetical protein
LAAPKIKAPDQRGEGRGQNTLKEFKAPAQGGEAGDNANQSPTPSERYDSPDTLKFKQTEKYSEG